MRDIKFRAWNKNLKQLRRVVLLDVTTCDVNVEDVEGLGYRPGWDSSHVELMQFTGTRTYEDVEIYEGDIIEFQLRESGKRYRSEVVFIEGSFMADMATHLSTAMYVKVLGNIYEHPGLLKESQ